MGLGSFVTDSVPLFSRTEKSEKNGPGSASKERMEDMGDNNPGNLTTRAQEGELGSSTVCGGGIVTVPFAGCICEDGWTPWLMHHVHYHPHIDSQNRTKLDPLFYWGLCGALDSLNGQAYGAKQYHKIGSCTYCALISTLHFVSVCLVWMYTDKILVLVGQDAHVAVIACRYSMWLIASLSAYAILQSQVRFLQSQSLVLPIFFISLATLCFHVPVCWVLVFKSGLGNTGAALAISFSYWLNVILLGFYMRYSSSCERTRIPYLKDVFPIVKKFFQFAIPSDVMACLEWWSFEIIVLISGLLPNSDLSSSSLHYNIPFGISVAARFDLRLFFIASMTLFCCRHVFAYAYSNEKDVVTKVTQILPLVFLSLTMDGIVRGIGWQHIGAYANLTACYLFGIPAGVLCGLIMHLRGQGLWVGMLTRSSVQGILLALVIAFTNWKKQAMKARERIFQGTSAGENGLFRKSYKLDWG
ncbi:protein DETOXIFICATION 9-like [Durio zibethinus]|uniref:Protein DETOXIFICATION n=1 Tax=Durio zibethinus TaxID=66656 RepID=A0A6P6AXL5_DURZI|nr:protein DETOXIFICATION 9-like [Durio zibethinus]